MRRLTPGSDDGLSEVVGFILVLAVLMIAASFYVTYVVPAQGREAEIQHMRYIAEEFSSFKTTIDAMWINGRTGVETSRTIFPGTLGGKTQGSLLNIPLFSPIGSGGVFLASPGQDMITYTIDGALMQPNSPSQTSQEALRVINIAASAYLDADHLTISNETNSTWLIEIYSINRTVNATQTGPLYDLTATIVKNGMKTMDNLTITRNIALGTNYPVNILDPSYGLAGYIHAGPVAIRNSTSLRGVELPIGSSPGITTGTASVTAHPMGSFEYHSQNNYWIMQNYIYQEGGVFINQTDGEAIKILPLIAINRSPDKQNVLQVTIGDLTVNGNSVVGGTSPVQVTSVMDSLTCNRLDSPPLYLVPGVPNANRVSITVSTTSPARWSSRFSQIILEANARGVPAGWLNLKRTEESVTLTIDPTATDPDIQLTLYRPVITVQVQPRPV